MSGDVAYREGVGALPTAGQWLSERYGPHMAVVDGDTATECENCQVLVWLGDANEEVDGARRLYTCVNSRGPEMKTCGGRLIRITQEANGKQMYRRFGETMEMILRSVVGNDVRIQRED